MRLDIELVNRNLYPTRAKAVAAIRSSLVSVNGITVAKNSTDVNANDIIAATALPYIAGRGSLKLSHALDYFNIDVAGAVCLDVGASTGGFTEVLLSRGASRVIAVDVGTNQMIAELKNDARVTSLENTDIRGLLPFAGEGVARSAGVVVDKLLFPLPRRCPKDLASATSLLGTATPSPAKGNFVDLIVIDVSFVRLSDIADSVARWNSPKIIALIKPQFEVSSKNGIVKNNADRERAIGNAISAFMNVGYENRGVIESPVRGGSGNVEYLGLFSREGGNPLCA